MNWRNEIWSSPKEIETRLPAHLSALVGEEVRLKEFKCDARSLKIRAETQLDGEAVAVGCLELTFGREWAEVELFSRNQMFGGRGLCGLLLKQGVSCAAHRAMSRIDIVRITKQGWMFWPKMGAVPLHDPAHIEFIIESKLGKAGTHPLFHQCAAEIASNRWPSGFDALRALSDLPERTQADKRFKASIFSECAKTDFLRIDASIPGTRGILARRMGRLPAPFGA